MPKIQMPKGTPSLDMTPMVDLAFLLVTFFMLTSSFREQEAVVVNSPKASAPNVILPEKAFIISISNKGEAYIDITDQAMRPLVFSKAYTDITGKEAPKGLTTAIKKVGTIGLGMQKLPDYLETDPGNRADIKMNGIPFDTALKVEKEIKETELYKWAEAAYMTAQAEWQLRKDMNPALTLDDMMKFCIKADRETEYALVKKIMDVFLYAGVPNFQIITNFEEDIERKGK